MAKPTAAAVFFQVAYQSVVPELIAGPGRWHAADTRLSLSESRSMLAGPALGGFAVAVLSPAAGLGLDAASYAVSVASLASGTFLVGLGQGCFAVNAITLRQLNATPAMRPQATYVAARLPPPPHQRGAPRRRHGSRPGGAARVDDLIV